MEFDTSSEVEMHGVSRIRKTASLRLRIGNKGKNVLSLLISIYTRRIALRGILRVKKLKTKGEYSRKACDRIFFALDPVGKEDYG